MIMGKIVFWIAAIAIVFSLISGCVSAPQGTPTPVVTPVMTPIPTTAPTPEASVEVLNAPATAVAGQGFVVSWRVNNPIQVTIPHTAVHYGPDSKSEPLTLKSYPSLTPVQNGTIPADFSANITIGKTGIIYFRAHAIIGGANYWSDERMITITAPLNATSIPSIATSTATATTSGYGY
ncbi:MAG: hypothetical protein O8C62_00060 [Candidatus Methanoperedens sp.]|nr:hypothetical protein [Candidatus Methanoperedens sp.]